MRIYFIQDTADLDTEYPVLWDGLALMKKFHPSFSFVVLIKGTGMLVA
jgi:hypothetical protein